MPSSGQIIWYFYYPFGSVLANMQDSQKVCPQALSIRGCFYSEYSELQRGQYSSLSMKNKLVNYTQKLSVNFELSNKLINII